MENGAQMDYTWYPVYDRIVSQIDELLAKEKNRQVTVASMACAEAVKVH